MYSLFLGNRPAVFLHGLQVIRQALVTQGADFAGRPQGLMINHVTENKGWLWPPPYLPSGLHRGDDWFINDISSKLYASSMYDDHLDRERKSLL